MTMLSIMFVCIPILYNIILVIQDMLKTTSRYWDIFFGVVSFLMMSKISFFVIL